MLNKWIILLSVLISIANGRTLVRSSNVDRVERKAQLPSDSLDTLFDTGGAPFLSNVLEINQLPEAKTSTQYPASTQEQPTTISIAIVRNQEDVLSNFKVPKTRFPCRTFMCIPGLNDTDILLSTTAFAALDNEQSSLEESITTLNSADAEVEHTDQTPIALSSDNSVDTTTQTGLLNTENTENIGDTTSVTELITEELTTSEFETTLPPTTFNAEAYSEDTEVPTTENALSPSTISNTDVPTPGNPTTTTENTLVTYGRPDVTGHSQSFINVAFPYMEGLTETPESSERTTTMEAEQPDDNTVSTIRTSQTLTDVQGTTYRPSGTNILDTLPASLFHVFSPISDAFGELVFTMRDFGTGATIRTKYIVPLDYINDGYISNKVTPQKEYPYPEATPQLRPIQQAEVPKNSAAEAQQSTMPTGPYPLPQLNRNVFYRNFVIEEPNRIDTIKVDLGEPHT